MARAKHAAFFVLPVLVVVGAYPWVADRYAVDLLTQALLYAIFALGVDLLWGQAGIINLAPAAFFGLGAYAYALSLRHLPDAWAALAGVFLAILLPVSLALVVGYAACKARSTQIYFALITLAVGLGLEKIAMVSYNFTGGSNGITGVVAPIFFGISLQDPQTYFYTVVVLAAAAYVFCRLLIGSAVGRVLKAIRENELRAQAIGYDITTYKLIVFAVSAALGGITGALSTPLTSMAHPSHFGVALSMQAYVWVAVGGQGTLAGPFLSALGVKLLESWLSGISAWTYLFIMGLIFVLVVLLFPGGLAGAANQLWQRRHQGRKAQAAGHAAQQPVHPGKSGKRTGGVAG